MKPARPADQVAAAATPAFEEFVAASSGRLFTLALLLTGHRRAEAEDLVQDALERAYRHWTRIVRRGSPDAYVRQILVNAAVDQWRRDRRHRQEPLAPWTGDVPDDDRAADLADRDVLLRALGTLPPRQRAVLVLRYFEDLSEAQSAAVLGCSVGAIKSQASRGLARLRDVAASWPEGERAAPPLRETPPPREAPAARGAPSPSEQPERRGRTRSRG